MPAAAVVVREDSAAPLASTTTLLHGLGFRVQGLGFRV